MAQIISYPTATPASADYLVGSQKTTSGAPINPTKKFLLSSVVEAGLGYTAYTALLTQTGVLAPVVDDLKNNTGATMTWTRTGVGTYLCTASSGVFTATDKVQVFINQGKPGTIGTFIQWERAGATTIGVDTYDIAGAAADTKLDNAPIEIRIYT
tara:strand:+ start:61 stop:525 length:465 start_codon:yes stop_codon:yes gene_type:complete